MSAPLNLARRPLRNERLPTLLLAAACIVLGVLAVPHALTALELRRGGARDFEGREVALRADLQRMQTEEAQLRGAAASREQLDEWASLRELVDRRAFSWTGLFAALESAMPASVHLVSVSPETEDGRMVLRLDAVGRDFESSMEMLKQLQASPSFQDARLLSIGEGTDGLRLAYTVRYGGRSGGVR